MNWLLDGGCVVSIDIGAWALHLRLLRSVKERKRDTIRRSDLCNGADDDAAAVG